MCETETESEREPSQGSGDITISKYNKSITNFRDKLTERQGDPGRAWVKLGMSLKL